MQASSVPRSFAFPPCSWQQSPQQKPPNPAPAPLLPCSAPSVSVSPEQGMCSGHCGTCSQSPSSSFHPGFTNWPPSRACCLSFGSKGADRGPSSPQFLMLHFAPAPAPPRRLYYGGSRNPGVGAGSPGPQFYYSDTKHYGVCLCQAQVRSHSPLLLAFLFTPIQALGFLLAVLTGPPIMGLTDAESDHG